MNALMMIGQHRTTRPPSQPASQPYLGRVVTEDDGVQIAAVVMFDEIVGRVRTGLISSPQQLLVVQCLIQRKQNLH